MKKLNLVAFSFAAMLGLAAGVNAQEVSDYASLKGCLTKTGSTCTLKENITVTADDIIDLGNSVKGMINMNDVKATLDLNGYSIVSTGEISRGIINVENGSELTVEDKTGKGKISAGTSKTYAAISVRSKSKLTINGGNFEGYWYALTGNGSEGQGETEITINAGNFKALADPKNETLGIYHPQSGKLVINGGTISGGTGIEMRAGNLEVNGGTITGVYKPIDVQANGNGSTTNGSGIALAQHNTKLPINVTINKGTVEGFTAIYESNPQKNDNESIKKVTIAINGGTINAINEGKNALYSENLVGFVKGGAFNSEIDAKYISNKYVVKLVNGQYKVEENKTLEATDKKVTFESETALDNGYKLETNEATKEQKEQAETKLNEYYKDNKEVKDTTLVTLYDIKVSNGTNVVSMENGKFTISIDIDENVKYDNYKVIYIDSEGNISEVLDAKREGNKIVFETTHLSVYGVVGYNNVEVANTPVTNPNTSDNLNMIIIIGGLSLLMLGMSAYKLSKNN